MYILALIHLYVNFFAYLGPGPSAKYVLVMSLEPRALKQEE